MISERVTQVVGQREGLRLQKKNPIIAIQELTYGSFPTPLIGTPSPISPSFPLCSTPVVDELILLGFGTDATPSELELVFGCRCVLCCVGGREADRMDVGRVGTEAGTTTGAAAGGFGDLDMSRRPASDRDSRSTARSACPCLTPRAG